jgi:hypothetical protein
VIALASFGCGLLFGIGLLISGMTQPAIVLGFLDVFGRWNPALALVMVGALIVSSAGYALAWRQGKPWLAVRHLWPDRTDIDRPLVIGSMLFGVGWGLAGLCPGPAIENLASLSPQVFVFVLAMAAGMLAKDLWGRHAARLTEASDAALSTAPDG